MRRHFTVGISVMHWALAFSSTKHQTGQQVGANDRWGDDDDYTAHTFDAGNNTLVPLGGCLCCGRGLDGVFRISEPETAKPRSIKCTLYTLALMTKTTMAKGAQQRE